MWDGAGRLKSVSQGLATTAYTYAGDGVRLSQERAEQRTVYIRDVVSALPNVLAETTAGATVHYMYGLDQVAQLQDNQTQWLLGDGLGSVRQAVNEQGHIVLTQSYSPFGKLLGEDGDVATSFGFAGEQSDASTGLVFLRARYYDVQTGRFISKDPFSGITPLPQTLHAYTYGFNNPVNHTDPSGALPPWVAYPAGVLVQFFNDMNLGGVSAGYTVLTGGTLDDIHNRAFQAGRQLGRDISEAVAWFGVVSGTLLMGSGFAGAPIAAAATAGAPFTGGLSLVLPLIDWGVIVAGAAGVVHGGLRLAYNRCNPLPNVSYSTGGSDWDDLLGGEKIEHVYPGKRQSPNWPEDFEFDHVKKVKVNDRRLLSQLRKIERGRWMKVYENGYVGGREASIHYFESPSGKVFDLKVKSGWSRF